MVKTTILIPLAFASGSNSAVAIINIPFAVSKIHFKSISFVQAVPPALGDGLYICVFSDLSINECIGITFDDPTYPINTNIDTEFQFEQPRSLSGQFTFYLKDISNTVYNATSFVNIGIIAEFNSIEEL